MPELANRRDREAMIAAVLSRVLYEHGQRVVGSGGKASWDQLESELRRALAPLLLLVYVDAADQLSQEKNLRVERDAVVRDGRDWATDTAGQIAADVTRGTRERVEEAIAGLAGGVLSSSDFAIRMETLFGSRRAEDMAIGAVTDAVSAGEMGLIAILAITEDDVPEAIWWTEDDGHVCEVCGPLHGTGRNVWGRQFPYGPKAHKRCRCWLEWK